MISTGTKTITKIILSDIMFIQAKHLIYLIQGCIKLPIPPLGVMFSSCLGLGEEGKGRGKKGRGKKGILTSKSL